MGDTEIEGRCGRLRWVQSEVLLTLASGRMPLPVRAAGLGPNKKKKRTALIASERLTMIWIPMAAMCPLLCVGLLWIGAVCRARVGVREWIVRGPDVGVEEADAARRKAYFGVIIHASETPEAFAWTGAAVAGRRLGGE